MRFAVYAQANQAVQDAFAPGQVSPDLAHRIISHAAQADRREAYANSFVGEGLFGVQAFEDFENAGLQERWERGNDLLGLDYGRRLSPGRDDLSLRVRYLLYVSPLGGPMRADDEQLYMDYVERLREAAQLPYHEAWPSVCGASASRGDA